MAGNNESEQERDESQAARTFVDAALAEFRMSPERARDLAEKAHGQYGQQTIASWTRWRWVEQLPDGSWGVTEHWRRYIADRLIDGYRARAEGRR